MMKANKVEWFDKGEISQLDGSLSIDLHLRSEKGNRRTVRVTFDQYDMMSLAHEFHAGLQRVEYNLNRTRKALSGE